MRTIGRKNPRYNRGSALCDRCGTRWPRNELRRDAEGLLNCPQEGRGRDAVTLTRANVASARAYARDYDRPVRYPGNLDQETAEAILSKTGNLLFEDGTPMATELNAYMLEDG